MRHLALVAMLALAASALPPRLMAAPKPPVISVLYFESASPRGSGASDPGIERLPGDLVAYQAFSAAYQAPDRDAGLEILGVFEKAYPQSAYLPSIKGMMDYFPQ